jgi:hypothetical protein
VENRLWMSDEGKATSPADQKEFQQTLDAFKARQVQLKNVGMLLSRFEAQLTGTNSSVDGIVTSIVGLQGRSAKGVEEKTPALLKIILRHTLRDKLRVIVRETSRPRKVFFQPGRDEVGHNCRSLPRPSVSH